MSLRKDSEREFAKFVRHLLNRYDVAVVVSVPNGQEKGHDLRVKTTLGQLALVEIKLYNTVRVASGLIRQSIARLQETTALEQAAVGILATNVQTSEAVRVEAATHGISLFDYDVISALVEDTADLTEDWERLCQEMFIYRNSALPEPAPIEKSEFIAWVTSPVAPKPATRRNPPRLRGNELCQQLRSIKPGRPGASSFESVCVDSLKYIFRDDLTGWVVQKKTHTRLHRYDLIARVSSENDFWTAMISDFRARYIIFEFKNHAKSITQTEIYSTEKYLLPLAMRSTAIIIACKGANSSAYRVMAGALREAGKVILCLSVEQICEMLHAKDRNDDPSETIAAELDSMLSGLER